MEGGVPHGPAGPRIAKHTAPQALNQLSAVLTTALEGDRVLTRRPFVAYADRGAAVVLGVFGTYAPGSSSVALPSLESRQKDDHQHDEDPLQLLRRCTGSRSRERT